MHIQVKCELKAERHVISCFPFKPYVGAYMLILCYQEHHYLTHLSSLMHGMELKTTATSTTPQDVASTPTEPAPPLPPAWSELPTTGTTLASAAPSGSAPIPLITTAIGTTLQDAPSTLIELMSLQPPLKVRECFVRCRKCIEVKLEIRGSQQAEEAGSLGPFHLRCTGNSQLPRCQTATANDWYVHDSPSRCYRNLPIPVACQGWPLHISLCGYVDA
jgi:hypothetical protein